MHRGKPYAFHPEAWNEIAAADDWYRARSPEASVRFIGAVYDALERIARHPRRWPKFVHETRRYLLPRFPFSIVYQEAPDQIEVIAVAHHKRRPGYWKKRL